MQIQISGLMTAVAVLAIFLALPSASTAMLLCIVIGVLVLLPTVLAPHGRKVEVAYWTIALQPLVAVSTAVRLLVGAQTDVPGLRDLSRTYRKRAKHYAELERRALCAVKEQREDLAFWSAVGPEREKMDKAVESWAERVARMSQQPARRPEEVASVERMATYYARMRSKWQRLAMHPWLPVEPDPQEPEQ
jgi:hypothetical protein